MFNKTSLLLALALAVAPLSVSAATITDLYNTGVNNSGTVLSDSTVDSHYTITSAPSGAQSSTKTPAGYPFGYWLANDSDSAWIGLNTYQSQGAVGNYTFHTTFTLAANAILSSASISGLWGTDDYGLNIYINGVSTGYTTSGFSSLGSFAINSGFVTGTNTLDFVVYNTGGPIGLRVDNLVGSYQTSSASVPDGGLTVLLLGSAFTGLVALRRKSAK